MSSKSRRQSDKRDYFNLRGAEGRRVSDVSKEVRFLIREALDQIESGNAAAAVWRLVDAAGLTTTLAKSKEGLMGASVPTGRGWRVINNRVKENEDEQPESKE